MWYTKVIDILPELIGDFKVEFLSTSSVDNFKWYK